MHEAKIYRLIDKSSREILKVGTLKDLAQYADRSYGYMCQVARGSMYSPQYDIDIHTEPRLYRYIKPFQIQALERFGNTIIRTRHEKLVPKYIEEFKEYGYDVEVEKTQNDTLVVRLKR